MKLILASFIALLLVACAPGKNPVDIDKAKQGAGAGSGKPTAQSTDKMTKLAKDLTDAGVEKNALSPDKIVKAMNELLSSLGAGPAKDVDDLQSKTERFMFDFDPATGKVELKVTGGDVNGTWLSAKGDVTQELKKIAPISEEKSVRRNDDSRSNGNNSDTRTENKKELWAKCYGQGGCDAALVFIIEGDMVLPFYVRHYDLQVDEIPQAHRLGVSAKAAQIIGSQVKDAPNAILNPGQLELWQQIHADQYPSLEFLEIVAKEDSQELVRVQEHEFSGKRERGASICLKTENAPNCSQEQDAQQQ